MLRSGHILVINPGSTSTKLAIFAFDLESETLQLSHQENLDHSGEEFANSPSLLDQFEIRQQAVEKFLHSNDFILNLIMTRGAPLRPLEGGIYEVDSYMLDDLKSCKYAEHASNLAALIGHSLALSLSIPVYIADPITTDEFEPLARISGVPGLERKSRSHALNIKATCRKLCKQRNLNFRNSRWIVCHMGGGISVAAVKNGQIIDVNDALLGMGPFSAQRAGALPTAALLDLSYNNNYSREDLELLLSRNSGLKGYLGTDNLKIVEEKIDAGNTEAKLIYSALIYQIAKEISAMASVLAFQLDGILLTGGMAHSDRLCKGITERVQSIAPISVEAGENEMLALAQAGLRILLEEESVKIYGPGKL